MKNKKSTARGKFLLISDSADLLDWVGERLKAVAAGDNGWAVHHRDRHLEIRRSRKWDERWVMTLSASYTNGSRADTSAIRRYFVGAVLVAAQKSGRLTHAVDVYSPSKKLERYEASEQGVLPL